MFLNYLKFTIPACWKSAVLLGGTGLPAFACPLSYLLLNPCKSAYSAQPACLLQTGFLLRNLIKYRIYQHQYFNAFAINKIKSYVLILEYFFLSVLSLLSALIFIFLSDLSALVVKIFSLIVCSQVSFSLIPFLPLGLGLGLLTIKHSGRNCIKNTCVHWCLYESTSFRWWSGTGTIYLIQSLTIVAWSIVYLKHFWLKMPLALRERGFPPASRF